MALLIAPVSLSVFGLVLGAAAFAGSAPREKPVDYQREVRPILARHCLACHGADPEQRKAGLRLDTQSGATATLESGNRAIVPGDTDASDLLFRVTEDDETVRMPPAKTGVRLKAEEVAVLERWIAQGAEYAEHWAFVAPKRTAMPREASSVRARNGIDGWIEHALAQVELTPAPEADRAALLRRLSLDLRGLPPTPEEMAAFLGDERPAAYERAVDRYLADPGFGERWARVWLDLARYADSAGLGSDPLRPNMWRYRDWVIDAFNRNLPYDQFAIEQIAGDLLPNATLEQRVATAFHRNTMTNTEGGTDDEEFRVAAVKDRVATTGQVFMGLTLGCAQCHTHKYDPISHKEYYQFFAFFNQSADHDRPDEAPTLSAPTSEQAMELARAEAKIAALTRVLNRSTPELASEQAAWEADLGRPIRWTALAIESVRGESGSAYLVGDDGGVSAVGPNPAREVIEIAGTSAAPTITSLRVETRPDASLANKGAGRAADGNFVLSRVTLETEPATTAATPRARTVRIELPGDARMLSLAEVEVYSGATNVARTGEAQQSSVGYDGVAERAIDGNTNGQYYGANSTTHTGVEANPWWEVTLRETVPIDRVVVWNRTDGGVEERLAGFRVVLLDEARSKVFEREPGEVPRPSLEVATRGRKRVALSKAFADFSQGGFAVEQILAKEASPNTGWAIAPQFGKAHWAAFVPSEPLRIDDATRLIVRLEHQYKEPRFTLGSFQISVTADANAAARAAVPAEVLAAIDTPSDSRTDDQRQAIARHFRSIAPQLQGVRDQIAALEKSKPKPPAVPVMADLPAKDQRTTRIMNKGSFLDLGDTVAAAVPVAFHAMKGAETPSRLDLAHWLVDRRNPLTSRVAVNRVWAQLFGVGLVETEEDFGTQGELPSHPELLDWLALEFEESGWDTKQLLRTIVTSATYRQAAHVPERAAEVDPRNRLLSHMPRVRLEAEMVRDQALSLAGLLCRKVGGPSVYPPQPDGLWQAAFNGERTWTTSTGPDRYRRGVYTFWRRTVPYPSMATFDAPSREICAVKRIRTNTPLQAFVTLNDPAFVEAAQALARRIQREGGDTAASRAEFGLKLVLGRAPDSQQVGVVAALYERQRERFAGDVEAAKALATDPLGPLPEGMDAVETAAWTAVANVLLNLDGVLTKG